MDCSHHPDPQIPKRSDMRLVFPARISPICLSVVSIALGMAGSWWCLTAIPFIWLGSIGAQPNLNCADGCLSLVAAVAGFCILPFHELLGLAIVMGIVTGYIAGFIEKILTSKPLPKEEHPS